MYEVRVREVPQQTMVTEAATVTLADVGEVLPDAIARVARAAGEVLGTGTQPWLERDEEHPVFVVSFEQDPHDGPALVEVRAPVAAGGDRIVPAHRQAYVRVRKSTMNAGELGLVYQALEKWVGERDLRLVAAPCEVYWTDFMSARDDDEVLDVAYPIA